MAGVRRKRSQKKKRINSTAGGRKLKKKNKTKVVIENKTVRKAWDQSKTVKENFKEIGLSYNTNLTMPVNKKKQETTDEVMDVDKIQTKSVVSELEAKASNGCKKEKHISPGEARHLWALIQDYGENYKAMMHDKRNYYQDTACQLKRKCERFLNSSQDFSSYLNPL